MELNTFITNVLFEISSGIKNANQKLGNNFFEIEPFRRDKDTGFISFDIAVKTSENTDKAGNAGIQVLNIGLGGRMSQEASSENANRIKFYVLPSLAIK